MRIKRFAAPIVVAAITPLLCGAVSVAAGHLLCSHIEQPALDAAYGRYRIDRVILFANGSICCGVVGLAISRLPVRKRFATALAVIAAAASLPAYVLVYLFSFKIAMWLGLGWSSSVP
jgi:hypothetical protein